MWVRRGEWRWPPGGGERLGRARRLESSCRGHLRALFRSGARDEESLQPSPPSGRERQTLRQQAHNAALRYHRAHGPLACSNNLAHVTTGNPTKLLPPSRRSSSNPARTCRRSARDASSASSIPHRSRRGGTHPARAGPAPQTSQEISTQAGRRVHQSLLGAVEANQRRY